MAPVPLLDPSALRTLRAMEQQAELIRAKGFTPAPREGEPAHDELGLFGLLLCNSFDGIILNARASRRIIEVSDAFCALSGYAREELLGRTSVELGLVDEAGVRQVAARRADEGVEGLYETRLTHKDGSASWVEFSHQLIGDEYVLTILRDVTNRRGLEDELRRLADSDPLTGVLNTRRFHAEVEHALLQAHRFGDQLALLIVDIDSFKAINDNYGHAEGDVALCQVATALRESMRETDFVGRLGGDEFGALLIRPEQGGVDRVVRSVHQLLLEGTGPGPRVHVSIGVAQTTTGATDVAALFTAADQAMYVEKASSRRT